MKSANPPQWKFRNPWDKPGSNGGEEFDCDLDAITPIGWPREATLGADFFSGGPEFSLGLS